MHTVAALYVQPTGIYSRIPGVDLWPEGRDARTYAGPLPVVAHPPCDRWSRLAHIHKHRPGKGMGDDGGCFAAALAAVERWGGALEHPAGSAAWPAFGLPEPAEGGVWRRSLFRPGWSCLVEQGHYGHPAPKATLLYFVGPSEPPPVAMGTERGNGPDRPHALRRSPPRRHSRAVRAAAYLPCNTFQIGAPCAPSRPHTTPPS